MKSLWVSMETIHDVTYFAPEARAAHEAVGLRGFWRGYVAMRAAPLGEAPLGLVTAVFYNFAPRFLARSLPEVWSLASPSTALEARLSGALAVLGSFEVPVLGTLRSLVSAVSWAGRPLGAANAALPWPSDPVGALWHACTVLREHRGDGHNAVLAAEGIDGVEAHVLRDAADGCRGMVQPARGWTDAEWDAALDRLTARGLLASGSLTPAGIALRSHIEARTDTLGAVPYASIPLADLETLDSFLRPIAQRLVPSVIPHPNPVGAPAP
ncbi:hypothetical protein SAMN05421504_104129 [Amycolatopsis xylanica]|uniref:SalK n=1 Tax=Amycolatopsis xylanica TaxID=589385 RepID=A0A1H3G5L3_9PSEU|nr:hypothetical protein [Amycolatopsis xylanica]SDX98327.1 hypothetical protein SAMN05421504_104129 [Amycolatopsis xylanica]